MGRPKKPKPWTFLYNDTDGTAAIVVPDQTTDVAEALCEAIVAYHGGPAEPNHPAIQQAATTLRVRTWRSCTLNYWEREDGYESWWASDGDGLSFIHVVELADIDLYGLGDEAAGL